LRPPPRICIRLDAYSRVPCTDPAHAPAGPRRTPRCSQIGPSERPELPALGACLHAMQSSGAIARTSGHSGFARGLALPVRRRMSRARAPLPSRVVRAIGSPRYLGCTAAAPRQFTAPPARSPPQMCPRAVGPGQPAGAPREAARHPGDADVLREHLRDAPPPDAHHQRALPAAPPARTAPPAAAPAERGRNDFIAPHAPPARPLTPRPPARRSGRSRSAPSTRSRSRR
jgi:hypothetical protein